MLCEIFQIFLPFVFRILTLLHSIIPISHRSSHYILDVPVDTHKCSILGNLKHVILLRNSCLLGNHSIVLYTVVIVRLFCFFFVGSQDTSSFRILPRNPY